MKIAVISFTKAGSDVCRRLTGEFLRRGEECRGYVPEKYREEGENLNFIFPVTDSVGRWTQKQFGQADGLIYIGAAGIAVRAIAPYLKDKMTDPAVVVIDDQSRYAVSLLSGHVGGANALAEEAAQILGAVPVITTASDVRGLTAVDVWARRRGLLISDRILAKETAAALVNGEEVGFFSDYPLEDGVPEGYVSGKICRRNVWVTCRSAENIPDQEGALPEDCRFLRLIPPFLSVGIGCRKYISEENVEAAVFQAFERARLDIRAAGVLTSIDLKKQEEGILKFAEKLSLPFVTFSAEELEAVGGTFTESEFVRKTAGTGNVCERAAVLAAGGRGRLWMRKQCQDGVTVAIAEERKTIGAEQRWRR